MQRIEWPTMGLIVLVYGGWAAAGLWLWPVSPWAALAVMAVMTALHSSLTHECLHGHPTRNRWVNEALVALPLSLIYPFRRYKATHLAHHADERLTDPFDDPESWYQARWRYQRMPFWLRAILKVNNTMLGRVLLGPWVGAAGFLGSEARLLITDARGVRLAWLVHLPALAVVLLAIHALGIPIWLYGLAVVWPSLSLIAIRTFAEHRWHEDPFGRTIIVERSPLALLFLNNNLHIVHHRIPGAAWYELPRLYSKHRDLYHGLNRGYVFPHYLALFAAYALTPKEPVTHPAWRLVPETPPQTPPETPPGSGALPPVASFDRAPGRLPDPPMETPA